MTDPRPQPPGTTLSSATQGRLGELLDEDVTTWLTLVSTPGSPQPGSALDSDAQATAPYFGWHIAAGSVGVAVAYLDTFRQQLGREHSRLHPHPPIALLMGALEASALAVWLVRPDEPAVRRGRALAAWWSDLADRDGYERAERYKPAPPAKSAADRQAEVRKLAATLGLPSSKGALGRTTTSTILDAGTALGMNRQKLARLWSLSSGVAPRPLLARHLREDDRGGRAQQPGDDHAGSRSARRLAAGAHGGSAPVHDGCRPLDWASQPPVDLKPAGRRRASRHERMSGGASED